MQSQQLQVSSRAVSEKKTCFSAWGWNFYLIVILCRWTEAKQEGDQTERQIKKKKGGGGKPLYKAAFILLDVF